MKNKDGQNTLLKSVLVCAAAFGLMSCNGNESSFPQIASPPPFDYEDGEELRSEMHQLAFALQRLDMALASNDIFEENPTLQRSVMDSLDGIERIATDLKSQDLAANHPFLVDGMDRFLADVDRAQFQASRSRYYMAGRISGSCVSCHQANY